MEQRQNERRGCRQVNHDQEEESGQAAGSASWLVAVVVIVGRLDRSSRGELNRWSQAKRC